MPFGPRMLSNVLMSAEVSREYALFLSAWNTPNILLVSDLVNIIQKLLIEAVFMKF